MFTCITESHIEPDMTERSLIGLHRGEVYHKFKMYAFNKETSNASRDLLKNFRFENLIVSEINLNFEENSHI